MLKHILKKSTAFLLVLSFLLGAMPVRAANMEQEGETLSAGQDELILLPESGYVQPGAVTLSWEEAEGAQSYTLTLDNVLTERSPDLVYTTNRLSRRVNLTVSPAWQCTLTAEFADGSVQTQTAEYRTAVLYDESILQATLSSKRVSLNLAGTQGVFVPVCICSAEPSSSLQYTEADDLPSIEEVQLAEDVPFDTVAKEDGFQLLANGAVPNQTYRTQVYVRLAGTDDFLPAGKLTIRTYSEQPTVSAQSVSLDLFAHETGADITLSASEGTIDAFQIDSATDATNPHPDWFCLSSDGKVLFLSEQGIQSAASGTTSLRFLVQLNGFESPVSATCSVALTDSSPAIQLEKKSVSLHPDGQQPFTLRLTQETNAPEITGASIVPVERMTEQEQKKYALNAFFTAWYDGNGGLRLSPTGKLSSGNLLIHVWFEGSSRPVQVTLRIRTTSKKTLSLSASSVKLYRTLFPEESAASIGYAVQPLNLAAGELRIVELDDRQTEQPLHSLDWHVEDGKIVFTANQETSAGTLRLRVYAENADKYRSVKIQVIDRTPSLQVKTTGKLDLSKPETTLSLQCNIRNATLTLEDAEAIELSDERLEIVEIDGNVLQIRWLGGLTKGKSETCAITISFPGGIQVQNKFTYTPIQSTVLFAFARDEITVQIGEQAVLPLTVNKTGKQVEWSANSDCVQLENGIVTAIGTGKAVVTATAGKYQDTIIVWCTANALPADGSYTLTAGNFALTASDQPVAREIDGTDSQRWTLTHKGDGLFELRSNDGRVLATKDNALILRYPSGNTNERFRIETGARIYPYGMELSVTIDQGEVTLQDGSLTLTPESPLQVIRLGIDQAELSIGDALQLSPETDPAGLENELLFRSSDENIVSVDATGKITAHEAGVAVLTVFHAQSSISAQITVLVKQPSVSLTDGVYRIQNTENNLFLTVLENGVANGTPVVLQAENNQKGQLFRIRTSNGNAYLYPLCSQNGNGKVLDVYRGNDPNAPIQAGCQIDVWSFGDEEAQAWTLTGQAGNYLLTLTSDSNLYLTGNTKKVTIEHVGKDGQSWNFIPADESSSENDASVWVNPLSVMTTTQAFGGGFSSSSAYWGHLAWDGIGSTSVMATADGVVQNILSTSQSSGHGNIVLIRHSIDGQIFYSSYSHLRDGSICVSIGQRLYAGTVIGEMGATGNVTGRHLHFCIFSGGSRLPYSYCGSTFSAVYRDYTGNYRLRYYDPVTAIQTNGKLVRQNYYG